MKHIRLYLFVLFTACSMFMVCPFAYADSMPNEVVSYLDEFFNYSDSTFNGYLAQIESECPYMFAAKTSFSWSVYFSSNEDMFIPFWRDTSAWFISDETPANCSIWLGTTAESLDTCYSINMSSGRYVEITKWTPVSIASTYDRVHFYSCSRTLIYSTSNFNYFDVPLASLSNSGRYGDWTFFAKYNSSSTYYFSNLYESNIEVATYTNDERLKLYKLWSSQYGDSLVVDLSAFRSYTPAAAYEFSNIVLTLTCNGVDTDYNMPLSSSIINNGWNNNSNLYTISTPVTDFTLSDTYDTYITKVSFSLDVSSPGGSGTTPFYISTNFPLDVHHSSITPGAVPTPIYDNPTVKTPQDLASLASDMSLKSTHNLNGTFVVHSTYTLPEWADSYIFELNRYSDNSDSNYAGRYIDGNPNNSSTRYVEFEDVVYPIIETYDNVYDVFVFPIHSWYAGSSIPSTIDDLGITGYLIFYTDRYFQRQETLSDVDILTVLQSDANNFVDFVEYLQVRLDDFENKSLDILNPLYDETTFIDDKLASILYAVNNIESYNDSSIVSLLTDIKGLLSNPANEIDTPQECIQLYEAHPNYFDELWGTPTPALRSASVTPSSNNPYISSDFVRADLVPAWWEGKTLTMIYILKNDGETSRFYNDILNGLFDSYENLIESDNSFNTFIDSLFKTGYDYTDSFYGHMFDLDYNPEAWDGGFADNE